MDQVYVAMDGHEIINMHLIFLSVDDTCFTNNLIQTYVHSIPCDSEYGRGDADWAGCDIIMSFLVFPVLR